MTRSRRLLGGGAFAFSTALVIAACGGGSSRPGASTPTSPSTPTAPTLTSVTVTCPSATTTQIQCAASARFSDATTQVVTSTATWRSSDASIATVSAAGLVSIVGNGSVDITATYQTQTGSVRITVSRPTFTVTGTVTDGTSRGVLPNIAVELSDLGGATRNTSTSGTGTYSFGSVSAGAYTLTASNTGYQATSQSLTVGADSRVDLILQRSTTPPGGGGGGGTSTLTCNGAAVPATVSCPNNQGIQAPTAQCNDLTYSCSQNRSGTCSTHQGVRCYVCPGPLC